MKLKKRNNIYPKLSKSKKSFEYPEAAAGEKRPLGAEVMQPPVTSN